MSAGIRVEPWRSWWWRPPAFVAGAVLLVLGLFALGAPVYVTSELAADRAKVRQMAKRRALVVGNSHAYAVLPKEAGLDGFNFAHPGQDLFEAAYIVRSVKRSAPRLDQVLITLSYFTFVFDNAAYTLDGNRTKIGRRIQLYSAFGPRGFIPGDSAEYLKGLLWPVITGDHWESRFHATERKRPRRREPTATDVADAPDAPDAANAPDAPSAPTSHLAQAGRRCTEYSKYVANMRAHHPNLERDTFELLQGLVHELEDAGVQVILLTPPYTAAYNACFDTRWQNLTRDYAARITRQSKARYLDWGDHPTFSRRDDFFRDSDHIAVAHRAEFSRALRVALRKLSHAPAK